MNLLIASSLVSLVISAALHVLAKVKTENTGTFLNGQATLLYLPPSVYLPALFLKVLEKLHIARWC